MTTINIIVAYSTNRVIGKDNKLIWNLPSDLKRFKELTSGKSVIMGRKTFESIGRPLPNRENIIITRNKDVPVPGCLMASSLEEAISISTREIFVIGGSQIYQMVLDLANDSNHQYDYRIYATVVNGEFEGDSFFPKLDKSWVKLSKEDFKKDDKNEYDFSYVLYEKAKF